MNNYFKEQNLNAVCKGQSSNGLYSKRYRDDGVKISYEFIRTRGTLILFI
jgi:hypothetical protein